VENIVAGPVKWIANVAYSDGIEKVWNAVAGILHEKSLKLPDIHFASGGVVPGKHHQDNVPVYTTPGEGILSLHGMGALGNALGMHPHAALHALNGGANNGSSSHFLLGGLPGIGLVKRGLHDVTHNPLTNAVGNVAKSGLDALAHMARGAMAAVAGPILHGIESAADHTLGGMGGMGQLLDKLLHNRIDAFLNWIKGKDSQAPAGGTVQYTPTAGVEQWRGTVLQALQLLGLSPTLADRVLRQMQTESGGNPNIIQGIQDINSATGNLARGLMQVVPTTFAGYHVPGTSNSIYDPLANIAAGLNWDMHKFGGNPGLVDLGQGHGYDIGGYLPHGLSLAYNGLPTSKRELIMPEDVMVAAIRKEMAMAGGGGSTIHIEKLEINNPVDGLDFKKQLKDGIDEWHQERKERKADPRWPS
jgi:SLT domain-containing protein